MRALFLLVLVAALAGGALLLSGTDAPTGGGAVTRADVPGEAQEVAPAASGAAESSPPDPGPAARRDAAPPAVPSAGAPLVLAADVYLRRADGSLDGGTAGTLQLEVLANARVEPRDVPVEQGRLATTVTDRARVRVVGGQLVVPGEGLRTVRFEQPVGFFAPGPERLALVGIPVPRNVLRVVAAGTGADLDDVLVRFADDPGGGRLAGAERGALVAGPAPSPVTLPYVALQRPTWLEVEAPGRAPARLLLDPRRESQREVSLLPAAGALELRLRGPGRAAVDTLVLHRTTGASGRPVAAHLTLGRTASPPDPWIVVVEGLAAAPHEVRAATLALGVGGGALTDLATAEVSLAPGADASLDIFVPAR